LELAEWVLKADRDWDSSRIEEIVAKGVPQTIRLRQPVPVRFVYLTAWSDGNGMVHFREDIYGRDGTGANAANYGSPDKPVDRPRTSLSTQ
jgi:murein L,D-transpeptidase YcbB/YkuD